MMIFEMDMILEYCFIRKLDWMNISQYFHMMVCPIMISWRNLTIQIQFSWIIYFDNSQSRLNINGSSSMWFWLNCIICGLGQPACYNLLRSQNDMKGTAEILGDRAAQVKIKIHPGKWWSFRFPGSQTHFIPMKPHVFQWFHGQNRLIHFSIGPGSPKGTVLWWWPGRIGLNSWIMFEAINQYNSNLW